MIRHNTQTQASSLLEFQTDHWVVCTGQIQIALCLMRKPEPIENSSLLSAYIQLATLPAKPQVSNKQIKDRESHATLKAQYSTKNDLACGKTTKCQLSRGK